MLLRISFGEIGIHLPMMGFFAFIYVLIFTALISSFGLAEKIPKTMNDYAIDYDLNVIMLNHRIFYGKEEQVEKLPISVYEWYSYIWGEQLGLDEERHCFAVYCDKKCKNSLLMSIQENLTSGEGITPDCNKEKCVWISEEYAAELSLTEKDLNTDFLLKLEDGTEVRAIIKGFYRKARDNDDLFISSACLAELPREDAKWEAVYVGVDDIRQYNHAVRRLEYWGYRPNIDEPEVNTILLIDYAVYIAFFFMLFLVGYISIALTKMYVNRRTQFLALLQTQGLGAMRIRVMIGSIASAVATVSFAAAVFLAPLLNNHFIDTIHDLIGDMELEIDVFNLKILLVYLATQAVIWGTCMLSRASVRKISIVNVLRRNNE